MRRPGWRHSTASDEHEPSGHRPDPCLRADRAIDVVISPTPAASAAADQSASRDLLERVARAEIDGALRIWSPAPCLALSRLDELRPGAERARELAVAAGIEPLRRMSGGHAVVLGPASFCVGFAERAASFEGTQERYQRLSDALIAAFASLGIDAEHGELADEWCPGTWSIRAGGVKLAGLAQRAIKGAAWADAVVQLGADRGARDLLVDVYAALDLPLDPGTIGSVSEVAGRALDFAELAQPLADALSA
jgi:octanoyl-[GcvH]:protein N-octanoyltransferase